MVDNFLNDLSHAIVFQIVLVVFLACCVCVWECECACGHVWVGGWVGSRAGGRVHVVRVCVCLCM